MAMEEERKKLIEQDPRKNAPKISSLGKGMNDRAHELARELLKEERRFLDQNPRGVPLEIIPLNDDSVLNSLERELRAQSKVVPDTVSVEVAELQRAIAARVDELAADFRENERAFLDQNPEGIPLNEVPLDEDPMFCEMERVLRNLKKNPELNAEAIKDQQYAMNNRVHDIAREMLLNDRGFLNPEPQGVPLSELPLDDPLFNEMELARRKLKEDPERNAERIGELEKKLNDRADELAKLLLEKERAFLDPNPEGIPLERLPLNTDPVLHDMEAEHRKLLRTTPRNDKAIHDIEEKIRARVRDLALAASNWEDAPFHETNKNAAEKWPRICELYPEGIREAVVPERTLPSEVVSAPREFGYLTPFIAALSRHPPLLHRLFESKVHPINGPYVFTFFDPNSNPVRVDIDDRVPCDANMEPKFTQVPRRSWYPLLLEKAYAKFVGGYARLDQCTPHETLRDLTGRPVSHLPLEDKRSEGIKMGDFRAARYWRGIEADLAKGDIITCMSNKDVPDGIHPQCSYALMGVIHTVKESNDPSDIVIKLHNCYYDEPLYTGPLNQQDPNWTAELRSICDFDAAQEEYLYLPQPVFLRNFSSMQRCHINCGDRLTAVGEWSKGFCGGNPKFTTFRNNPIYLVENKSARPATILAELRHQAPVFYDADNVGHYHQTGLALLEQDTEAAIPSGAVTNTTHKFIQKGIMLDTREVCTRMEVPPTSTCLLIPYTMKRGSYGKFSISIYPGDSGVTLMPLRPLSATHVSTSVETTLKPGSREGRRIDFMVNGPCDLHLLLRQNKITDPASTKKGDVLAEDDVMMMLYDENMLRLATTGDATSAREHSLVVQLHAHGRYTVLMGCPNKPVTGDCPCTLTIHTPKKVVAKIVPLPPSGTQTVLPMLSFPRVPRSAPPGGKAGKNNGDSNGTGNRRSESQGLILPAPRKNVKTPLYL
ncbi:calpain cysteine peptidase [Trypanosoma grayi]|uniref:calpain cysteine peptidase n=1 Tax=Trypanosoma grayi TaxID=71804 RepID=UPI0004F4AEC8|nr:calpain cysteine peptidase [Trypanosoma grayi]KEG06769.1 calpain cysteine peptidase [Trypanosoma grayi]